MTSRASLLMAEGLLDWPTAVVGFRRHWMSSADVAEVAVAKILDEAREVSVEQAELTSSSGLSALDVEERLVALAEHSPAVAEETAVRRWLFASLIELDRSGVSEETMLQRLQEVYAEFGFPEELRFVSPYNLTFDEWVAEPGVGKVTSSPLEWFRGALGELRAELLRTTDADSRSNTEEA